MPNPVEEYFRLRGELAEAEQNVETAIRQLHSAVALIHSGGWKSDSPVGRPRTLMARLPEWPSHRDLCNLIKAYETTAAAVEHARGRLHADWPPGGFADSEPETAHRASGIDARN